MNAGDGPAAVPAGATGEMSAPAPAAPAWEGEGDIWAALGRHLNPGEYRPARSPAVITIPMVTRHGDAYYLLANRARGRYARLSPEEFHLWNLMDGARSVQDLIYEYFTAFHSLAFDAVLQFVAQLRQSFMLADPPRNLYAALQQALPARRTRRLIRAIGDLMTGRRAWEIRHIDALMDTLHRRVAWVLYITPLQVLYVVLSVVGGALFLRQFASGRYELFAAGGSYGMGLVLLVGLNFLTVVVHEASHALTCKHYGGEVYKAGLMLYFGLPAAFVDTTDIWTKPASARMATTWAGPYSGVVLAGLAAVIVQAMPGAWIAPILFRLCFLWLTNFLFNVVPFLELDGYYLAVDWLEMPLLRARALRFFRTEVWQRVRHHERLTGQERLLAWFGGLSFLFSGLVLALALWGWQSRFKSVSASLWSGGIGSKLLLVLLFVALGFPLASQAVRQVEAALRRLAAWMQRWRTPHGRTLRERIVLLGQIPCLSDVSSGDMAQIAMRTTRQFYRRGQVVLHGGTPADRFLIVERGLAEMWVGDEPAPRRRLTRGDYFGDTALRDRTPYAATLCAGSLLTLLCIARRDFDRWMGPHMCPDPDARLYTLQALRRHPIFAALPARQLDGLAAAVVREQFSPGALVHSDGRGGDVVYLVDSGQAEAVAGAERRVVAPGDFFGDAGLRGQERGPETVRALTPLEVLRVPRADFLSAVAACLSCLRAPHAEIAPDGLRRTCCGGAIQNHATAHAFDGHERESLWITAKEG
jgi:putative peptide zinc metalloprotease protein